MAQWLMGLIALGEIKYLIFLFSHSDNEGERSVEFRHATCNVTSFWWKVGDGVTSD